MKRIVIMGATSGIGLRVAEIFAKAGWLVGAAGRKEKVLRKLQSDYPEKIRYAQINISSNRSATRSFLKPRTGLSTGMN